MEGQVSLPTHPDLGPPYLTALATGVLLTRGAANCLYLQDGVGIAVAISGRPVSVTGGAASRTPATGCWRGKRIDVNHAQLVPSPTT